jgi:arylsulfatase A-like enzyme
MAKQDLKDKPNVVLFISHDTGASASCEGGSIDTPNLDRVAKNGVRFTNHFSTAPQCTPSRGCLITGKYPHSNGLMGLTNYGWNLPEHNQTIPKILSQIGYSTHLIGLQHEHAKAESLGYEEISDRMDFPYIASEVIPKAEEFLQRMSDKKQSPFYTSIGVFDTHRPFPFLEEEEYAGPIPDYIPDHPASRRDFGRFLLSLKNLDNAVGRVLTCLEETGLVENTLFLFTVDHGPAFPRTKCTMYDPALKTTLLMQWRGHIRKNQTVNSLISNVDILPTLFDLLEIPISSEVQGQSFAPLLFEDDAEATMRSHVFSEMTHHDIGYNPMRAIRTDQYKYIRNFISLPFLFEVPNDVIQSDSMKGFLEVFGEDKYNKPRPEEELYDLKADPLEHMNLAADSEFFDIKERLRKLLEWWMQSTKDPILKGPVPAPRRPEPFIY